MKWKITDWFLSIYSARLYSNSYIECFGLLKSPFGFLKVPSSNASRRRRALSESDEDEPLQKQGSDGEDRDNVAVDDE